MYNVPTKTHRKIVNSEPREIKIKIIPNIKKFLKNSYGFKTNQRIHFQSKNSDYLLNFLFNSAKSMFLTSLM